MSRFFRFAAVALLCGFFCPAPRFCLAQVGTAVLSDGTRYNGVLDRLGSLILVDDDLRLIVFGQRHLADLIEGPEFEPEEEFNVPQVAAGRSGVFQVVNLAAITRIEPFDEFGRRTVYFLAARGKEVGLVQGIVRLTPRYARLLGLNYRWEGAIATRAIPQQTVLKLLKRASDSERFTERVRVVNFLARVGWLLAAERELDALAAAFPDRKEAIETARRILAELKARRALEELRIRQAAGQHRFVYGLLHQALPPEAPGEVVVGVRSLRGQYEQDLKDLQVIRTDVQELVGELRAELRSGVAPIADEIRSRVTFESLSRLKIYLDLRENRDLSAEARLGLLISAWLAGVPYAQPNLPRALELWRARRLIERYVRSSPLERERIESELEEMEGLTPELARELIRYLPPPLADATKVEPGVITRIDLPFESDAQSTGYYVLLPPEYHPEHRYPAVVTLRGRVTTAKMQVEWWARQAQRNGYIVIAPDYLDDSSQGYRYSVAEHLRVIHAVRDASLRFSIDRDRVFLSGHYEGAEAAWDIGLGHADQFAGLIPIAGAPGTFTRFYRPNGALLSIFLVDGSLNDDSPQNNRLMADPMMRAGMDVRFLLYHGRGREPLTDIQLEVFDWMRRRKRTTYPVKFECRTGRVCDDQFYYVTIDELLPNLINNPDLPAGRRSVRTGSVRVEVIRAPNTIMFDLRGPVKASLWLGPDVVDFSRPIKMRVNGRAVPNRELEPSIAPLLQYYYRTADRERAFLARWRYTRR